MVLEERWLSLEGSVKLMIVEHQFRSDTGFYSWLLPLAHSLESLDFRDNGFTCSRLAFGNGPVNHRDVVVLE